jgi:hypothetical protein
MYETLPGEIQPLLDDGARNPCEGANFVPEPLQGANRCGFIAVRELLKCENNVFGHVLAHITEWPSVQPHRADCLVAVAALVPRFNRAVSVELEMLARS